MFPFALKSDAPFDVVGFGTNAVDHLVRVAEYPAFNTKVEFLSHEMLPGGEVASTLAGLQRLGFRTAYAGRFGDDAEGELGRASLISEGVDLTYAESIPNARTQTAVILTEQQSGERTIMWHRDRRLACPAEEAPLAAAALGRVLHMTPHDTAAAIRMAQEAKRHRAVVSLDIDALNEGIDELMPLVDIAITSAALPHELTGERDLADALRAIRSRYGCSVVGSTLGAEGSIVICGKEAIATPAFDVPGGCVDTTGAGDAFRAGFLYGVLSGRPPAECARLANAVAALKCRMAGARNGLPQTAELTMLIKNF